MDEKNENFSEEYDSLKDAIDFQNNMFNPGHYIAKGRVPPTVSAPGNATFLLIVYFIAAALFFAFGLFLFFSNVNVIFVKSQIVSRLVALITMMAISGFFTIIGFGYLRKAKKYYRTKAEMESEEVDDITEDAIWQRTCPECGKSHDIDYPKCPHCNFIYLD